MKKLNFILLVVIDVFSIVVAYGSIIEVKGVIAYLIYIVQFFLNILFLKKYRKKFHKAMIYIILSVYLFTGVIFLIRENGRKVISQNKNNKYIYMTYEINPGAMGHLSYEDKVYYNMINTDFLTVRIVKSEKHYRYRG